MHLPAQVPPPELTPAESAHYKTNKSSTHKYKTYNKCIGKYPKLSPNAQPGKYRQMELLSHAQHCVFVLLDLFTVDARRQVMLWRYYIRLARSWVAVI